MSAFYIAFLNNIKNNIKQKVKSKVKSYSTVTTLAKFLGLSGLMPFSIEII